MCTNVWMGYGDRFERAFESLEIRYEMRGKEGRAVPDVASGSGLYQDG